MIVNASVNSRISSHSLAEASSSGLLPTAIGFFFAFRLLTVLLTVRIFDQDAQAGVAAGLALNYLFLAVVAFDAFGPSQRTFRSMLYVPTFRWVLFFFFLTGASLFWSSTSSLTAAVAFWFAMAADTAMIVLLLRTRQLEQVIEAVMRGYVWGACGIAVLAWLLPSQSDLRLGDEELLGPNHISYVCAFAFFFAQYLIRRKSGNWSIHALLLAVTLLRSLSKTTIIAFVAAQAYILWRDRTINRKTKWAIALAAAIVLCIFWGLLENYFDVYTNAGNQSETLTGRLGIWAYIFVEAIDQPWIGHGFHSVWKVIPPFGPDQFEARHAHNELLQQFYAYGVIGVITLIGIYGSLFRNLRKLTAGPQRTFFFGMLIFVLVRGLADTEAFDLSLPMWTIVMIGCLIDCTQTHREVIA
jgi:exopolysaccharide production protein ExoQ